MTQLDLVTLMKETMKINQDKVVMIQKLILTITIITVTMNTVLTITINGREKKPRKTNRKKVAQNQALVY
ncbi:hypothetical protein Zmor_005407 [Zophobas morio]|uniref:Uncharacterized protein n=1 Tax=Zophobas morio TaxID=2755281 RepID=A0AA38MLM8_9CUCU|nr:hypothetical protein Zmor_005407 [Zophobas morio]